MKRLIAVIAIFMTFGTYAQSTTDANIYGHIVNAATGEHIADINIIAKGTSLGTTSNESGHFLLNDLPEGQFTIIASGVGFKSEEKVIELHKGTSLELTFSLEPDLVQLQSVVVSASRNEVNRKDASSIVNLISPRLFDNTASSCLAQGLTFQPGIRVEMNCQNCGFQQVRINGLDGAYTQLLIDSRPVFSALAAVYGIEQIPANMIERVEVIRGGGSSLFGTNAIAGTINIITREPKSSGVKIENKTAFIGGSASEISTLLNATVVNDNAGITVFGTVRDRQPFDVNDDGFSEIGLLRAKNAGFKAFIKPGIYSKLNIEYHNLYEYRRGGNAFDKPLHESDISEQAEHNINSGGLNFVLFSKNGKNKLDLYASAQQIHRNNYAGVAQDKNAYGTTKNHTILGGIQYNRNIKKLIFMPAELTGGLEYLSDDLHDEISGYNHTTDQNIRIGSVFVQNEWKTDKSGILLGLRIDKHNLIENLIFSPRASFRYVINNMITFRTGYSKGFRAPQVYDEDLHGSAIGGEISYVENILSLKPESSHSISASLDFDKSFGKIQTELLLEGFFTTISDVFILVEKGINDDGFLVLQRDNGSGARVKGLNIEAKAATENGLVLQAGITLQKSLYDEAQRWSDDECLLPQRKMFRSPDTYGYFTADWNPAKKLVISFTGNYTGKMLVQHFAGYIPDDEEVTTPEFFDAGINLTYDLKIRKALNAKISLGAKNIFNSYQKDFDKGISRDAGYIYGPIYPRTFNGGISFEI